jgi:hypothetical protein
MPTVVTVPASYAILTDPTAPGGPLINSGTVRPSGASFHQDGERVQLVGERSQLIQYDSTTYDLPITFVAVTGAQLLQIRAWAGRTLLLRRADGTRYYGGYLEVAETQYPRQDAYDAAVTFLATSYTDTV